MAEKERLTKKQKDDLYLIQVRLFRLAQKTWNLGAEKCSELFNKYKLYDYIQTCYGFFHIQGDEANLEDISEYLRHKGVAI
jgi:hypothetical protein